MSDFQTALKSFVQVSNEVYNKYMEEKFPTLPKEPIAIESEGKRFVKTVFMRWDEIKAAFVPTRVHAFIEKETGNIFKPAGYNKPALNGARGNIYDNNGKKALTNMGDICYKGQKGIE